MTHLRQARAARWPHAEWVLDSRLSEAVVFEVSGFDDATQLCRRLAGDWFTWVQSQDGYRFVTVLLDPRAANLAKLMRVVQQWAADFGREGIPFELDGRRYALYAGMKAAA